MIRAISFIFAVMLSTQAMGQGGVPAHGIPVSRGGNVSGVFKSVGPCASNVPILGAGASVDPACGGSALASMAYQAASGVAITGGTITGMGLPSTGSDVANKTYVDAIGAGKPPLPSARLATAAILPNTPAYSNGAAGVGATLTAGSNAALSIDGVAVSVSDVVLVKNQASAFQNGLYTVTAAGSAGTAYVLTRSTVFDTTAEMVVGSSSFVTAGSTNANITFSLLAAVPTVGTDAVNFTITGTSLQALTNAFVYVGNASNIATGVALSGDCTIVAAGTITCTKTNGATAASQTYVNTALAPLVPGAVHMWWDTGATAWKVTKPDGTLLSTGGTTSQGLQEALNYAATNLTPLIVDGNNTQVLPAKCGGCITITSPLIIPASFGAYIQFRGASLICSGLVNDDFIRIDSQEDSQIWFDYIANCDTNIGATVRFKPTTSLSDGTASIFASRISFTEVYSGQSTSARANIVFDLAGNGNISNNTISGTALTGLSQPALTVTTNAVNSFWGNEVNFLLLNRNNGGGPGGKQIQIGDAAPSTNFSYSNTWRITTLQPPSGAYGVNTYGSYDMFYFSVANNYSSNAVVFQSGSIGNTTTINGSTVSPAISGQGTTNRVYINATCTFNGSSC